MNPEDAKELLAWLAGKNPEPDDSPQICWHGMPQPTHPTTRTREAFMARLTEEMLAAGAVTTSSCWFCVQSTYLKQHRELWLAWKEALENQGGPRR
jgi:hypothetical protein